MVAELTALRDKIDEVDKGLLELLAKRLELVAGTRGLYAGFPS